MKEVTITLNYEQVKMIDEAVFEKWMELDNSNSEKAKEKAKAYDELVLMIMELRHNMKNENKQ